MNIDLRLGDCLEVLKTIEDNSIDSIVTDPPYGLSFMNKHWDYEVPSVAIWQECLRVLKPGGHLLSFAGSRTYHRIAVNIEDAGFEIRDQIMWIYGSGFPKSLNIGKAIDKKEGNERENLGTKITGKARTKCGWLGGQMQVEVTKGNSEFEGWGTCLKPAHEPIVVARKPISEKSIAENVLKWGVGGLNIDGSRIEGSYGSGENEIIQGKESGVMYHRHDESFGQKRAHKHKIMVSNPKGRFPANIIFDEEAGKLLDEQSGITTTRADINYGWDNTECEGNTFKGRGKYTPRNDKGGASRFFYCAKTSKKERNEGLEIPNNHPTLKPKEGRFPANIIFDEEAGKLLDEQSGTLKSGKMTSNHQRHTNGSPNGIYGKFDENHPLSETYGDSGGASRFFYCAKTSQKERNEGISNNHPTVKPITLMSYLIKLVTPSNGIVLDPFMGSGSTGKAAIKETFNFIGIEREQEYFDIAKARIEYEYNKHRTT